MDAIQAEKAKLSRYEIPLNEGKAKQWIASLSSTDIGESTRRVFHGLVDFNRRLVPPLVRIRTAERLRPKLELLLVNLQRHLSGQSFPLSARGQKISDLNQSLLLEFAGLYQLAALDMLNQEVKNKRPLQIAIYRVVDYLGKYLLSTYSVYIRTRETVWHDIHHIYLLASERGLDKQKFTEGDGVNSIEQRYIQINLLALFKPYSLRQEEAARVAKYINNHALQVSISTEPVQQELLGNFVHAAVLNNDEPAIIMPYGDLPHSPTVRVFNVRQLVVQLDKLIHEVNYEDSAKLALKDGLSRNLAKRMIYHLTTMRNREHNRFDRDEKMMVVTGMDALFQVVNNAQNNGVGAQRREEDLLFNNMLYGEGLEQPDEEEQSKKLDQLDEASGVRIWQVRNSSVGGYGLHWDSRDRSSAKVGELIGLRDMNRDNAEWMTGVIKWIEHLPKKGLHCGAELLSVKTLTCEVSAVTNRTLKYGFPVEGLILPAVEGVRAEPVIILPAYIFVTGDELTVRMDDQEPEQQLALLALDECLGTFAHFYYKALETSKTVEEDEDFSSLWDAL